MACPDPRPRVMKVLRGGNDVHEYEHELLETYSQSSGSLSYDSYQAVESAIVKQYRAVATAGKPFDNLACRIADERICTKNMDKPQIVPVSAAALHELNRRHVRKPLHRVEQRMRVLIPAVGSDLGSQTANSDLLELYDKTLKHYTSSPMMKHKAFRLDVICTPSNIRPSQFRLDLIALNKTRSSDGGMIPGAYKSKENLKVFQSSEVLSHNEVSGLRNKEQERKAQSRQKRKEAERIKKNSRKLRGSRTRYPENTAFGGMTVEKHVEKVRKTKSKPKSALK